LGPLTRAPANLFILTEVADLFGVLMENQRRECTEGHTQAVTGQGEPRARRPQWPFSTSSSIFGKIQSRPLKQKGQTILYGKANIFDLLRSARFCTRILNTGAAGLANNIDFDSFCTGFGTPSAEHVHFRYNCRRKHSKSNYFCMFGWLMSGDRSK